MAAEDFSFPTVTDTCPRFMDSPPLWRVSSTSLPDSNCHEGTSREEKVVEEEEEEEEEDTLASKPVNHNQRKSFSCVESSEKRVTEDDSEDEEEKMDMLWEDFNEELNKSYGSSRLDTDTSMTKMVELGCVPLKMSKTGGAAAMLSARRPNMVVIMKVLKKLFLLHHTQRSLKRRASDYS